MTIRMAEVKADSFIKLKKVFEEDDDLRLHCGLEVEICTVGTVSSNLKFLG